MLESNETVHMPFTNPISQPSPPAPSCVVGRTLEELKAAWHDEAVAALGLVHGGQIPIVIYKTVFVKQVRTTDAE